jgi:hypothetical protein
MYIGLLYIIVFAIIGIAMSSRRTIQDGFVFPLGIISLILSSSALSSFLSMSVTKAGTYSCGLFLTIFAIRLLMSHQFRNLIKSFFLKDLIFLVSIHSILSLIILRINFDYASQNFDAYYAIQDGEWLSTHSANSSSSYEWQNKNQELLPLGWSSSTLDRYGVSYLFAISKILPFMDLWGGAQFLGLSLFIISFYTLYSTIRACMAKSISSSKIKLAVLVASIAPFSIMQFQYFMFGQLLALPILYFLIYKLSQTRDLRLRITLIIIPLFFFVAYPAMFFVSILAIALYNLWIFRSSEVRIFPYMIKNLVFFGLTFITIIFSAGSAVMTSMNRFLIWTITNTDTTREVSWSTLKIFSQFSSGLFAPLVAGLIPYPFKLEIGKFVLGSIWVLSVFIFVTTLRFFKSSTSSRYEQAAVFCVHGTLFFLMLFAFITDKSYLVMKLNTWFYPLLIALFFIKVTSAIDIRSKYLTKISLRYTTISLVTSILIVSTSITYLSRTTTWTNFPNIIKPNEYEEISKIKSEINQSLLISSPTIEESIWLSGRLGQTISGNTYGLQEGGQSLGVGMNKDCSLPKGLANFDSKSAILFPKFRNDIAGKFVFSDTARMVSNRLQIQDSRYLQYAEIIIGSGTFPPIDLIKSNISLLPGNDFARWSSNQICLGLYSKTKSLIRIKFEYVDGPDLESKSIWQAFDASGMNLATQDYDKTVTVLFQPKIGWNLIQVVQPSCFLRELPNRWYYRADDRSLCFLVGDIEFKPS